MVEHLIRRCFARFLLLGLLCNAPPSRAADPGSPVRRFDIPAGDAATALALFTRQSGVELLYSSAMIEGMRTAAVRGEFSPEDALARMLKPTDLVVIHGRNQSALAIIRAPLSKAASSHDGKNAAALVAHSGVLRHWLKALLIPAGRQGDLSIRSAAGIITGNVTNLVTGEVLKRAIVTVPGTNVVTTSGPDGHYVAVVPAGSRMLQVQYIGLETASVPVTITAGETLVENVRLTSDVYHLEKYTVHSLREGEEQALQDQRDLPNVTETMSTDAYGPPPANPGMLFVRMPEVYGAYVGNTVRTLYVRGMPPNFVMLLVDGNQVASSAGPSPARQIQIEQYGTAQTQEVQLILEPTPDMPVDAIGGIFNLITKRVYDVPDFVQLTFGTSWLDLQNNQLPSQVRPGEPDINLLAAKTFSVGGGKNNLGIEFAYDHDHQGSTSQQDIGPDLLGPAATMLFPGQGGNSTQGSLQSAVGAGYNFYGTARKDTGGFDLSYKPNAQTILSLKTTYDRQYYDQQFYRWQDEAANAYSSFVPGSTQADETTDPTAIATTISSNYQKKSLNYTLNPDAVYSVLQDTGKLELQGVFSYANIWYPNYEDVDATDTGTAFSLDRVGYTAYNPMVAQVAGPSWYNAANYVPSSAQHYSSGAPNSIISSRLDYTQSFDSPVPSYLKMGVGWQGDHSRAYSGESLFSSFSGPTSQGIVPWLGQQFAPTGQFGPLPFLNLPDTKAGSPADVAAQGHFQETPANAFSSITNTLAANVNYQENISDAYLMGGVTLGKLTVLGGLREEYTTVEGQQLLDIPESAVTSDTPAQNVALAYAQFSNGLATDHASYKNVLPGIFFIYEPIDGLLAKANYTVTVTRPPVTDILPGYQINPETLTIIAENPNIKPYTSQNFDFNLSKYFEPVGLFEVGVFLKQITNYINTSAYIIGSGVNPSLEAQFEPQYAGYTLSTDQNFGSARFRGFYASYQQQFTGLPGWLGGFGLAGNITFLETQGNYGTAGAFYENFENFAPCTANYGVTYVYGPLQLRLMANYASSFLVLGSYVNTAGAYVQLQHTILSASADYAFGRSWDAFLAVNNITNEYTGAYSFDGVPNIAYKEGVGFNAGIRYTFR